MGDTMNILVEVDFALDDSNDGLNALIRKLEELASDCEEGEWPDISVSLQLAREAREKVQAIGLYLEKDIQNACNHLDYMADLADAHYNR